MGKIGLIGLGNMGAPMAMRLLARNQSLVVHSRRWASCDAAIGAGASWLASAREVAEAADVVITALPTVDAVMSVYREMQPALHAGQVVVDHSTVDLEVCLACAQVAGTQGASFLDAPVSGGPAGVTAGTLIAMVGGNAEVIDGVRPILDSYCGKVYHCGPLGSGQALKLVNQLLTGIHVVAAAEAVALSTRLGISEELMDNVVMQSYGSSAMFQRNLPRFISGNYAAATPIRVLLKDLRIVQRLAAAEDLSMPLLGAAVEEFSRANSDGFGDADIAAVYRRFTDG